MTDLVLENLKMSSNEIVRNFYEGGKSLTSKKLKNYTSGDGKNLGLEEVWKTIVTNIVQELKLNNRVKIDKSYLGDSDSLSEDPQRLDLNVWLDEKIILMIESRAWVDKPFYTLKRAVVKNIMELEHTKKYLHDECEFGLIGLSIDILERLRNTLNKTLGYGERIKEFCVSPHRRGYGKQNYFYYGHNQKVIDEFVEFVYNKLSRFKEEINE